MRDAIDPLEQARRDLRLSIDDLWTRYEAAATTARWDRDALERHGGPKAYWRRDRANVLQ